MSYLLECSLKTRLAEKPLAGCFEQAKKIMKVKCNVDCLGRAKAATTGMWEMKGKINVLAHKKTYGVKDKTPNCLLTTIDFDVQQGIALARLFQISWNQRYGSSSAFTKIPKNYASDKLLVIKIMKIDVW